VYSIVVFAPAALERLSIRVLLVRLGAKGDAEMEYMLLIYQDEAQRMKMSDQERGALFAQYGEFTKSIEESGAFKAGAPLQPTTTASTVRMKNGKTVTTDGPFAETKEQLAGYYLVDAKNLDEAISIAARIPAVRVGGTIEVRPVMQVGAPK